MAASSFSVIDNRVDIDLRKMIIAKKDSNNNHTLKLIRNAYYACVNRSANESLGLAPIKEIVQLIGGWPLVEGNDWNEEQWDFVKIIKALRAIGAPHDHFFRATVESDQEKRAPVLKVCIAVIYEDQNTYLIRLIHFWEICRLA